MSFQYRNGFEYTFSDYENALKASRSEREALVSCHNNTIRVMSVTSQGKGDYYFYKSVELSV